jgi:hypothetical protein
LSFPRNFDRVKKNSEGKYASLSIALAPARPRSVYLTIRLLELSSAARRRNRHAALLHLDFLSCLIDSKVLPVRPLRSEVAFDVVVLLPSLHRCRRRERNEVLI